jgi:hypothetical protein
MKKILLCFSIIVFSSCYQLLATCSTNNEGCVECGPYFGDWKSECPKQTNKYSITPSNFPCVELGKTPPNPTQIVTPGFSIGKKSQTIGWDCPDTNKPTSTNIAITFTPSGTIYWSPTIPSVFTNVGVFESTAYMDVDSSDSDACPAHRETLGTVRWNVVNTNCTQLRTIGFSDTDQWKLDDVYFSGGPSGGGAYYTYDGFAENFNANVSAICQRGCTVYTNVGVRIASFTHDEDPNDYIVVHKVGQGGVQIPLPSSLPAAVGTLFAKVLGNNIALYGVDSTTLSTIVSRINSDKPSSTNFNAGQWKTGQEPCK